MPKFFFRKKRKFIIKRKYYIVEKISNRDYNTLFTKFKKTRIVKKLNKRIKIIIDKTT